MTELLSDDDRHFTEILLKYFVWYKDKSSKGETASTFTDKEMNNIHIIRSKAFLDKKAHKNFLKEHEKDFSDEECRLFKRLEHCIIDRFILTAVKKDSILLLYTPASDSYILQVTPWTTDALMFYREMELPRLVEAALFPSDEKIIYDLLNVIGVSFGSGIRKSIRSDIAAAKAKHGIITSLPIQISKDDPDLIELRGLMTNKESIINNWDEIQRIINRKPEHIDEYYQKLGAAYTRMRRKELKNESVLGWFALIGWTVIAGGKTRQITEKAVQSLITPDKYARVVYFEVKN